MKYILKNKDIDVLEFDVLEYSKEVAGAEQSILTAEKLDNIKILNEALMPKDIEISNISKSLESYIKHRKIPSNREYANRIIESYRSENGEKLMDYVNVSLALSLNDSYWIIQADKNYQWKDFNLYENNFEQSLQLAAFGIISSHISRVSNSPEYTTNGMLKKCWDRENNQIYLLKSHSNMYESKAEPLSEYIASQIADIMGFAHVKYDLIKFHNEIVSKCPIFTNENEGFLPMYYCLKSEDRKERGNNLSKKILEIYDEMYFQDIMVFDGLICNIDRHLGNFGMMINNNTQEFIRPAPIFDNGLSMVTWLENADLTKNIKEIDNLVGNAKGCFDMTFNQQLKFYTQERHIRGLKKLKESVLKKPILAEISTKNLKRMEYTQEIITKRAGYAIDFVKNRHKENSVATTKATTIPEKYKKSTNKTKHRR